MTGDHRGEAQSPQRGGKGGGNPPALLTRANSSPRHSARTLSTAVATSEAWVTSRERGTRMPAQGEGKVGSARRAGVRRWGSRRCVGRVREGGWPSVADEGRRLAKRGRRGKKQETVQRGSAPYRALRPPAPSGLSAHGPWLRDNQRTLSTSSPLAPPSSPPSFPPPDTPNFRRPKPWPNRIRSPSHSP